MTFNIKKTANDVNLYHSYQPITFFSKNIMANNGDRPK